MYYEVRCGYWKYGDDVALVTDDLFYARERLLHHAAYQAGPLTVEQFGEFDIKFQAFAQAPTTTLYFSIRDYYFKLRGAQAEIAVGGLSTLPLVRRQVQLDDRGVL